jgi:hypothetical protein
MTDREKLHKFIVEYFGGCWHIGKRDHWGFKCEKCGFTLHSPDDEPLNLDSPDGFMWVWEQLLRDKRLWSDFFPWLSHRYCWEEWEKKPLPSRIDVVYGFLQEEKIHDCNILSE